MNHPRRKSLPGTLSRHRSATVAFSLIELLIIVSITGVLSGLGYAGLQGARAKASQTSELAAGRTLALAYQMHAQEHNGRLMYGIDQQAGTAGNEVFFEPYNRNVMGGEATQRYPFRLARYYSYKLEGAILGANNRQTIENDPSFGTPGAGNLKADYGVSLYPRFGMNINCVGGEYNSKRGGKFEISPVSAQEAALRTLQLDKRLILFVTSGVGAQKSKGTGGFHRVAPPRSTSGEWTSTVWSESGDAAEYGYVDARHGGKAIVVFTDGSTEAMGVEELRDMRLWSKLAQENDDPNYVFGSSL